jgi:hypothetical protein
MIYSIAGITVILFRIVSSSVCFRQSATTAFVIQSPLRLQALAKNTGCTYAYKKQSRIAISRIKSGSTAVFQSAKATLTSETEWRLRFVLRNVSTEKNQKVNEIFIIQGKFLEDDGYEPPQGSFQQSIDHDEQMTTNADGNKNENFSKAKPLLRLANSRWQLSEDPNDRKDGLWIWGLFKEPLYPYMLLKLETDSIPFGSGDDSINPLQLFAQINHKRDPDIGAVLDGADLKVRQMETIQADPFGVSKVDVYEEISVGTISIQRVPQKANASKS